MSHIIWSNDEFFKMGLRDFLNNEQEQVFASPHLLFIDLNHLPEENIFPEEIKTDTIIFIIENHGDKYLLNKREIQSIEHAYKVSFFLRKSSLFVLKNVITTISRTRQEDNISIKNYAFTLCEKRVLNMIADGFSVSSISNICHISPKTVSAYKRKIMRKINVNSSPGFFRKLIISRSVDPVLSVLAAECQSHMLNDPLLNRLH